MCHKLNNPLKGVVFTRTEDSLKDMWNKMSNEKMIGVLHAFVLLKPELSSAMTSVS